MMLLILSVLLALCAIGVLIVTVLSLLAEINRASRAGVECIARIRGAIAAVRDETIHVRNNATLFSESVSAWQRVAVLSHEAGVLGRNIKTLGKAAVICSTIWQGAAKQATNS